MADKEVEIEVVSKAQLDEVEDLQSVLEETEETANQVSEAISELDSSSQGASDSTQELSDSLSTIDGSSASSASEEIDELGSSAAGASEEVDGLQSSLDTIEASSLMSISNELGSIGDKFEGMAQDINEASISVGQLATQTGMAEPQMRALVSDISNVTFPKEEAMMYIKNLDQMGVSTKNFAKSATDMDKINDAFGLGARTTNSLTTELAVLGVDANNVSSSFNALAYANANTKGGMENFYTFLKKYDAQLNELGYDVDQSSMIIAAATQKYGGGKAALSGLSSALKEAGSDSRALEQALGMEAGSLDNANNITGQYKGQLEALAQEEMEHKTLTERLAYEVDRLAFSMSGVLSPVASFMGMIGQAGSYATSINSLVKLYQSVTKLSAVQRIKGYFGGLKGTLVTVGSAAKTAALNFVSLAKSLISNAISAAKDAAISFAGLAKQVLLSGYNALKSAAMWVVEKASLVASTIATYAAEAAQWALNLAMSANPIGIIIVAITALIAILGYLYFNNETVKNAIDGLGQTFVQVGQIIYSAMVNAINWVIGALQNLWNYVVTLGGMLPANVSITGNNIVDTILRVVAFIATLPIQIGIIFTNIIAKALGFGDNFAQRMFAAAQNSVTRFASQISQLPGKLASELNNMLSAVSRWAATLPQKFWDAGVEAVQKFLSALGIASPGTMQRMMVWEITEMGRRVPLESKPLLENISSLGEEIISEFGTPTLGIGFDDTANATITRLGGNIEGVNGQVINLNVEVGTVDSRDRVTEIVDAVRRELSWNNTTAGRTV